MVTKWLKLDYVEHSQETNIIFSKLSIQKTKGETFIYAPYRSRMAHSHQLSLYSFKTIRQISRSISHHDIKETHGRIWNAHIHTHTCVKLLEALKKLFTHCVWSQKWSQQNLKWHIRNISFTSQGKKSSRDIMKTQYGVSCDW